MLVRAISEILDVKLSLSIAVGSKDIFSTLCTCRLATERSIRGDVGSIRFDFMKNTIDRMIWMPGSINIANLGTVSSLTNTVQTLFFTGLIPVDFQQDITNVSDQFIGQFVVQNGRCVNNEVSFNVNCKVAAVCNFEDNVYYSYTLSELSQL